MPPASRAAAPPPRGRSSRRSSQRLRRTTSTCTRPSSRTVRSAASSPERRRLVREDLHARPEGHERAERQGHRGPAHPQGRGPRLLPPACREHHAAVDGVAHPPRSRRRQRAGRRPVHGSGRRRQLERVRHRRRVPDRRHPRQPRGLLRQRAHARASRRRDPRAARPDSDALGEAAFRLPQRPSFASSCGTQRLSVRQPALLRVHRLAAREHRDVLARSAAARVSARFAVVTR